MTDIEIYEPVYPPLNGQQWGFGATINNEPVDNKGGIKWQN